MIIHAARRPRYPHDHTGEHEITHWTVEADDYDTGRAQILADIPDGWLLMGVRVER